MQTDIGKKIRARREALGMTQEELAHKVGYKSRVSINKIELQRDLPINKIVPIAKALGVEPGVLMGWEDNLTEDSAVAMASILKNNDDTEFIKKYNELTEAHKKEVQQYVDFLLSKQCQSN